MTALFERKSDRISRVDVDCTIWQSEVTGQIIDVRKGMCWEAVSGDGILGRGKDLGSFTI